MTREETKNKLWRGLALTVKESWDLYKYIEALEQQSCEDCISRADVLDLAKKGVLISNSNYQSVCKAINELPSVTPVLSGTWNYDFKNAPVDTPIHLLSKNPTMEFVGTITKNGGDVFRGKCIQGDADIFYRSAIVAWKW